MPYADFETLVTAQVRDDEGRIDAAALDSAIDRAVVRYSSDRPQVKVVDVNLAGGNELALPAGWEADFSSIISIEYPVDSFPPVFIEGERYRLYQKPDGSRVIRFDDALANAGSARVSFTVKQAVTTGAQAQDTVPLVDRTAVCKWAAADLCDQLAALYSNSSDSTIQADAVQYQNKASQRRAQAQAYRKQYLDHLGIDEKKSTPASASATVQLRDSLGGPRLFHGVRSLH